MSVTLHVNLSGFFRCQRHKFVIKTLLGNTQLFFLLLTVTFSSTTRTLLGFHCNIGYRTLHNVALCAHCLSCYL